MLSTRWIRSAYKQLRPADSVRGFYERIYSLQVVLWCLIYQRLSADGTLSAVVTHLREGGADRIGPKRRRISKRIKSSNTGSYNEARQRVPLALLTAALERVANQVLTWVTPPQKNRARFRQLLDGSTISMLATSALAKTFPPASNQSGKTHWCLMRVVVGFCARSGAILSAATASTKVSEQALAWHIFEKAKAFTLWIGDRGFGIWSIAAKATCHDQDVLVRLTGSRAKKVAGNRPLLHGEDRPVTWIPSRQDRAPKDLERKPVKGRLIYFRLKRNGYIDLWLFTTLLDNEEFPAELLLNWYAQRWQAELHFRSVKTHMAMEQLMVTTPHMARVEFYAGLIAFSLVRAVMWAAGTRLEEQCDSLSFSDARRVVLAKMQILLRHDPNLNTHRLARHLLQEVSQRKLPVRTKKRPPEIRRVRHKRQKFPPFTGSRHAARTSIL